MDWVTLNKILETIYQIRYSFQNRIFRNKKPAEDGTSISDDGIYPDFCQQAALHHDKLKNFRRNFLYRSVLEHVSYSQGLKYATHINLFDKGNLTLESIETDVGNPVKFYYNNYKWISPTTLRYLKVALEIESIFGTRTFDSICEIGAGYGGQARVISQTFHVKKYLIFDLVQVNLLIEKFLSTTTNSDIFQARTIGEATKEKFDLVISN